MMNATGKTDLKLENSMICKLIVFSFISTFAFSFIRWRIQLFHGPQNDLLWMVLFTEFLQYKIHLSPHIPATSRNTTSKGKISYQKLCQKLQPIWTEYSVSSTVFNPLTRVSCVSPSPNYREKTGRIVNIPTIFLNVISLRKWKN